MFVEIHIFVMAAGKMETTARETVDVENDQVAASDRDGNSTTSAIPSLGHTVLFRPRAQGPI